MDWLGAVAAPARRSLTYDKIFISKRMTRHTVATSAGQAPANSRDAHARRPAWGDAGSRRAAGRGQR